LGKLRVHYRLRGSALAARKNNDTDSYLGAGRAYHKALVEAGILGGGTPLRGPESGPRCD